MDKKYVYLFSEGDETMRELLGGKGANLAGMSKLGMPVVTNIMKIIKQLMRILKRKLWIT